MTELDQLMAVMEAAFDPHWREAWTRQQVEDSLRLPSTYYLLIDKGGDEPAAGRPAMGFVLARRVLDEEELLLLAVKPEARGRGFGRKLLRRFLDNAREKGVARVFLEMRCDNPAETLYRQCGFTQIGQRRNYYRTLTGTYVDALTFAKTL